MTENLDERAERLAALVQQHQTNMKIVREHQEASKRLLLRCLGELFGRYPELKSISWRQYTPYFNDGDQCEFSVCEAKVNDMEISYAKYLLPGAKVPYWAVDEIKGIPPDLAEPMTVVGEILNTYSEAEFLACFGDHIEVTITADGATGAEYDHD